VVVVDDVLQIYIGLSAFILLHSEPRVWIIHGVNRMLPAVRCSSISWSYLIPQAGTDMKQDLLGQLLHNPSHVFAFQSSHNNHSVPVKLLVNRPLRRGRLLRRHKISDSRSPSRRDRLGRLNLISIANILSSRRSTLRMPVRQRRHITSLR
jgi:hypothetical protein